MSPQPAVSVIVPVYNTERYLPECLKSLHAQTVAELEILLVNDGSTDASPELLRRAAARDGRMRVIDKPNGGYGSAVNAGLEQARGRYVGIVEADDLVDPLMFQELLAATALAEDGEPDIVKSAYWNYYDLEDGTPPYLEASELMRVMPDKPLVFDVGTHFRMLFQHPSVWSAIYRREFLEEKHIRMNPAPGAGWVDNPFLYETMLQARRIVWVPAAFYRYRQTNPDSSSHLKDFHIPFDRLREIRAIYDRLGVRDVNLRACLYNREFHYIKSVIERFGFSERDPEVFALIKETIDSMDPQVIYEAKQGIRREHIEYYEDVTGAIARNVKEHARCKEPRISVVVAMRDVRPYLLGCLGALAAQSLESIEVIAVDCGSRDRTAEVAEYYSAKDRRFMVVRADGLSLPEGYRLGADCAGGEAILFADPKTTFGRKFLARVDRALRECPAADLLLIDKKLEYVDGVAEKHAVEVEAAGMRDRLMVAAPNAIWNKVVRRDFYRRVPDLFDPREGHRCSLASTRLLAAADRVALMNDGGVKAQHHRAIQTALAGADRAGALEERRKTKFNLVAAFARECGDAEIERGFCCYVVDAILRDLDEMEDVEEERAYIASLKRDCLEPYGLMQRSPSLFLNIASFRTLQRLSFMSYDHYLEQEAAASRYESKRISQSTSYRVGSRIAALGPKLVPKRMASAVRKKL